MVAAKNPDIAADERHLQHGSRVSAREPFLIVAE